MEIQDLHSLTQQNVQVPGPIRIKDVAPYCRKLLQRLANDILFIDNEEVTHHHTYQNTIIRAREGNVLYVEKIGARMDFHITVKNTSIDRVVLTMIVSIDISYHIWGTHFISAIQEIILHEEERFWTLLKARSVKDDAFQREVQPDLPPPPHLASRLPEEPLPTLQPPPPPSTSVEANEVAVAKHVTDEMKSDIFSDLLGYFKR